MKKTIIVYGSTTGNCEEYAEKIAQKLGVSDVKNVADVDADTLSTYDNLLLGTSTWGAGEFGVPVNYRTTGTTAWRC